MDACELLVNHNQSTLYPGVKEQEVVENIDIWDLWYEWSDETHMNLKILDQRVVPNMSILENYYLNLKRINSEITLFF